MDYSHIDLVRMSVISEALHRLSSYYGRVSFYGFCDGDGQKVLNCIVALVL